jgi:hypothetical protein
MSSQAAATSTQSLPELLRRGADGAAIRAFLDGLSPADRLDEALSLHGRQVGQLYDAAAGGPALTLDDFVAPDVADETTIIFEGRNSLPAFSRFQKRFMRVSSGQIVGYNHQSMSIVTGPGYFVVKPGRDDADVPGELYFDYTAVPDAFPRGWPAYKPNDAGLSNLVYKNMKDYMRSVASNVVVGHAYKLGKSQGQYFLLARGD